MYKTRKMKVNLCDIVYRVVCSNCGVRTTSNNYELIKTQFECTWCACDLMGEEIRRITRHNGRQRYAGRVIGAGACVETCETSDERVHGTLKENKSEELYL